MDFAFCREDRITTLIEVKLSDNRPAPGLKYFGSRTPAAAALQLVHNLRQEESVDGVSVVAAGRWLATLAA